MSFKKFKARVYKYIEPEAVSVLENDELIELLDELDAEKEQELTRAIEPEVLPITLKSVIGSIENVELTIEDHMINIKKITKAQFYDYAKKYEIHLDRKRNKETMINEFIQKLKEKN